MSKRSLTRINQTLLTDEFKLMLDLSGSDSAVDKIQLMMSMLNNVYKSKGIREFFIVVEDQHRGHLTSLTGKNKLFNLMHPLDLEQLTIIYLSRSKSNLWKFAQLSNDELFELSSYNNTSQWEKYTDREVPHYNDVDDDTMIGLPTSILHLHTKQFKFNENEEIDIQHSEFGSFCRRFFVSHFTNIPDPEIIQISTNLKSAVPISVFSKMIEYIDAILDRIESKKNSIKQYKTSYLYRRELYLKKLKTELVRWIKTKSKKENHT